MILVRSPLRLTLGGGGTDLPSYAERFGGLTITAAIDRYVYVGLTTPFFPGIYLKYSEQEIVPRVGEIRHPMFRAALLREGAIDQIELTTLADIPGGTGLGSSSAFACALVQALAMARRRPLGPRGLAMNACQIELEDLQQPIGRQDQYASAYGGLRVWTFGPKGDVQGVGWPASAAALGHLEEHLLLFFTGRTRGASAMLAEQQRKTLAMDPAMIENLHECKRQGQAMTDALQREQWDRFAALLNQQWAQKKARAAHLVPPEIDAWYGRGLAYGAMGGKLVGAGGGGFLLFYTEQPSKLRAALSDLQEVRVRFDHEGTKIMVDA